MLNCLSNFFLGWRVGGVVLISSGVSVYGMSSGSVGTWVDELSEVFFSCLDELLGNWSHGACFHFYLSLVSL